MLSCHLKSRIWLITHSMESYQTDIQALLRDINDNYGRPKREQSPQPPLPSPRPISDFYRSQAERSVVPRNALAPIPEQKLFYGAQAPGLLDANPYSTLNDHDLDPYGSCSKLKIEQKPADCYLDRALMDEPDLRSPWQANSSMRTLPARRRYLPRHTAPHSPTNTLERPQVQKQQRGRSGGVPPMFRC